MITVGLTFVDGTCLNYFTLIAIMGTNVSLKRCTRRANVRILMILHRRTSTCKHNVTFANVEVKASLETRARRSVGLFIEFDVGMHTRIYMYILTEINCSQHSPANKVNSVKLDLSRVVRLAWIRFDQLPAVIGSSDLRICRRNVR